MAIGVLADLAGFTQEQYDLIARKLTGGGIKEPIFRE
jgi:hypothetical protein